MKTYQFDVNVIFEMDDIIEVQAKNEDEAFDELFQSAQEIVIGLGVWGEVDEELVDSALQELHYLVFAN